MSWVEWVLLGVAAAFTLLLLPALVSYVVQLFSTGGRGKRGRGKP